MPASNSIKDRLRMFENQPETTEAEPPKRNVGPKTRAVASQYTNSCTPKKTTTGWKQPNSSRQVKGGEFFEARGESEEGGNQESNQRIDDNDDNNNGATAQLSLKSQQAPVQASPTSAKAAYEALIHENSKTSSSPFARRRVDAWAASPKKSTETKREESSPLTPSKLQKRWVKGDGLASNNIPEKSTAPSRGPVLGRFPDSRVVSSHAPIETMDRASNPVPASSNSYVRAPSPDRFQRNRHVSNCPPSEKATDSSRAPSPMKRSDGNRVVSCPIPEKATDSTRRLSPIKRMQAKKFAFNLPKETSTDSLRGNIPEERTQGKTAISNPTPEKSTDSSHARPSPIRRLQGHRLRSSPPLEKVRDTSMGPSPVRRLQGHKVVPTPEQEKDADFSSRASPRRLGGQNAWESFPKNEDRKTLHSKPSTNSVPQTQPKQVVLKTLQPSTSHLNSAAPKDKFRSAKSDSSTKPSQHSRFMNASILQDPAEKSENQANFPEENEADKDGVLDKGKSPSGKLSHLQNHVMENSTKNATQKLQSTKGKIGVKESSSPVMFPLFPSKLLNPEASVKEVKKTESTTKGTQPEESKQSVAVSATSQKSHFKSPLLSRRQNTKTYGKPNHDVQIQPSDSCVSGKSTISATQNHDTEKQLKTQPSADGSTSSRRARLLDVRARSPALYKAFSLELKRSLDAASTVMAEEKSSYSEGSSVNSTKSSLSNDELGSIARRAANMTVSGDENSQKYDKPSPLSQMKAFNRSRFNATSSGKDSVQEPRKIHSPFKPVTVENKSFDRSTPTGTKPFPSNAFKPDFSFKSQGLSASKPLTETTRANNAVGGTLTQEELLNAVSAFKPTTRSKQSFHSSQPPSMDTIIKESKQSSDSNDRIFQQSSQDDNIQQTLSGRLSRADRYAALLKSKGRNLPSRNKAVDNKDQSTGATDPVRGKAKQDMNKKEQAHRKELFETNFSSNKSFDFSQKYGKAETISNEREVEVNQGAIVLHQPKFTRALHLPVRNINIQSKQQSVSERTKEDKTEKSEFETSFGYISRFNDQISVTSRASTRSLSPARRLHTKMNDQEETFQPFPLYPKLHWDGVGSHSNKEKSNEDNKKKSLKSDHRDGAQIIKKKDTARRTRTPSPVPRQKEPAKILKSITTSVKESTPKYDTTMEKSKSLSPRHRILKTTPKGGNIPSKPTLSQRGVFARNKKVQNSPNKVEISSPLRRGRQSDQSAQSDRTYGSKDKGFKYHALESPGDDSCSDWDNKNSKDVITPEGPTNHQGQDSLALVSRQTSDQHRRDSGALNDGFPSDWAFQDISTPNRLSENSHEIFPKSLNQPVIMREYVPDFAENAKTDSLGIIQFNQEHCRPAPGYEIVFPETTDNPMENEPKMFQNNQNIYHDVYEDAFPQTADPVLAADRRASRAQNAQTVDAFAKEGSMAPGMIQIQELASIGSLTNDEDDVAKFMTLRQFSPGKNIDIGETKPTSPRSPAEKFQSARSIFENASKQTLPVVKVHPNKTGKQTDVKEPGVDQSTSSLKPWTELSVEEKVMSSIERLYNTNAQEAEMKPCDEAMNPFSLSAEYASTSFPSTFDETAMETDPLRDEVSDNIITNATVEDPAHPSGIDPSGTSDVEASLLHGELYTEDGSNLQYSSASNNFKMSSNEESARLSSTSSQMSKSTVSREELLKARTKSTMSSELERLVSIPDVIREEEQGVTSEDSEENKDEQPALQVEGAVHESVTSSISSRSKQSKNIENQTKSEANQKKNEGTDTDTLRWWQKKYAQKAGGKTNSALTEAFNRKQNYMPDEIDKDDEDVFSGLEEDPKGSFEKVLNEVVSSPSSGPRPLTLNKGPNHDLENHDSDGQTAEVSAISLEGFDSIVQPPPPPPLNMTDSQKKKKNSSRDQDIPSMDKRLSPSTPEGRRSRRTSFKKKVGTIVEVSESEISDDPKPGVESANRKEPSSHSGKLIDGYGMDKVTSDITLSVVDGKDWRKTATKKEVIEKIDERSEYPEGYSHLQEYPRHHTESASRLGYEAGNESTLDTRSRLDTRLLDSYSRYDSRIDSSSHLDSHMDSNSRLDSRLDSRMDFQSRLDSRVDSNSHLDSHIDSNSHLDSRMDSNSRLESRIDSNSRLESRLDSNSRLDSRLDSNSNVGSQEEKIDVSESESDSIEKTRPTASEESDDIEAEGDIDIDDDGEMDADTIDISYADSKEKTQSAVESTAAAVLSFGYAIVDSFTKACKISESFPQFSNCTENATSACSKKGEDCAFMLGLDDATEDGGVTSKNRGSVSPVIHLNEAERKRWDQWEERDELSGRKAKNKKPDSASNEVKQLPICQTEPETCPHPNGQRDSSESSLDSSTNRIQVAQKREQAQSRLLDHAKKAQELNREHAAHVQSILSSQTEDTDVLSAEEKSLTTQMTTVHQDVLQKFSSMLRNDKVEVLKLNRHGKWQVRFITVSREIAWLKQNDAEPRTPSSSQCPQALLWYKAHNMKNTGLAGLKNDGRGGFMFSQLSKIERDPNINPPAPVPKKLKAKYGTYAGVKIKYLCDEGERDLIFCFQDKSDASAFCTAIDIIHKVVLRNAGGN